MDELLTEQIIVESTGDLSMNYSMNNHSINGGGTLTSTPKTQSLTTNRSLLKQLSSKLLQSASSKSTNNDNNTTTVNHSGNSTSNSISNSKTICSNCTTVSISSTTTNSINQISPNSLQTNSTITAKNILNNSTSSLNSTTSTSSSGNQTNNKSTINSVQATCNQTKCEQVNCKTAINSLNCSINLNESQSSANQLLTIINCQSGTHQLTSSNHSPVQTNSSNQPNNQSITMTNCNKCLIKFTVFRRKHQCNKCLKPFCFNCLQKIKIKDNKFCVDCSINKEQSKTGEQGNKTMEQLNNSISNSSQVAGNIVDQSINLTDCTLNMKDDNLKSEQIIGQSQLNVDANNQINNQLNSQINQINTLTDLDKTNGLTNTNLSINSVVSATNSTSEINLNNSNNSLNNALENSSNGSIINNSTAINGTANVNLNLNSNLNLNITNTTANQTTTTTKNDFVIISVLKKQGVTKSKSNQTDATTTKKVCFADGIKPGDDSIIDQQRTTLLLPSLITVNANLNTNLTATSQIPSSRISFKPFLAHSQLTYAQKGLILNSLSTSAVPQRTRTSKRHLSSAQRQQLNQQKLIQLSATSASLRNTAATYTVLTKTGSKLNQTSNNKHLTNNSTRSSTSRKYVYLTNGKLLVNSYSNYNDFYIKSNDMFQNEKLFTSYVLLA